MDKNFPHILLCQFRNDPAAMGEKLYVLESLQDLQDNGSGVIF